MPSSSATGCIVEASSDAYRMRFSLSLPASTWWDSLRSTFSNLAGERSLCTSGYQIVDDGLCHLGNFSEHLLEKAVADDWASSIEASRLLCANKSRHVLFYNIHVPKAAGSSAEQTLSNIIREDAADIISPKRMDELRPGAFFMQIGNHASYADFMRGVPGFPGRLISTANCSDLETSCGPPLRANLKVVNGHASRWSRHHCSTRQTWLTTPVGAAAHSTACTRAHVHTCTRTRVHTCTRAHAHAHPRTSCAPAGTPRVTPLHVCKGGMWRVGGAKCTTIADYACVPTSAQPYSSVILLPVRLVCIRTSMCVHIMHMRMHAHAHTRAGAPRVHAARHVPLRAGRALHVGLLLQTRPVWRGGEPPLCVALERS